MAHSSKLALVTLLGGLLSLASVAFQSPVVRAYEPCDRQAENRCAVTMPAADDAIIYHIEAVTATHTLSVNGMGQEHFEAMITGQVALYGVAAPTPAHLLSSNGMGQEHFEAMSAAQPELFRVAPSEPTATALSIYAPEHHEEIMAAAEGTD